MAAPNSTKQLVEMQKAQAASDAKIDTLIEMVTLLTMKIDAAEAKHAETASKRTGGARSAVPTVPKGQEVDSFEGGDAAEIRAPTKVQWFIEQLKKPAFVATIESRYGVDFEAESAKITAASKNKAGTPGLAREIAQGISRMIVSKKGAHQKNFDDDYNAFASSFKANGNVTPLE